MYVTYVIVTCSRVVGKTHSLQDEILRVTIDVVDLNAPTTPDNTPGGSTPGGSNTGQTGSEGQGSESGGGTTGKDDTGNGLE